MKKVSDSQVFVIPQSQGSTAGERLPTVEELEFIARWMDSAFQVPGTNIRFGLDVLLGLIPGLGDTLTSFVSLYILQVARRHGVSRLTMARMGANIALDYVVGIVPVVGDAFDVSWKANLKNVELLRRHIGSNPVERRGTQQGDWWFFAALVSILILLLIGSMTLAYLIVSGILSFLK